MITRKKLNVVSVHTDGSASRKAGDGGWAFVAKFRGDKFEKYGFEIDATNNAMELMGVVRALEFIRPANNPIRFYIDSQYVINVANIWLPKWKADGWKTVLGEDIKNLELIQKFDALLAEHRAVCAITLAWVRGHDGNKWNERADELAGRARKERITNWT